MQGTETRTGMFEKKWKKVALFDSVAAPGVVIETAILAALVRKNLQCKGDNVATRGEILAF